MKRLIGILALSLFVFSNLAHSNENLINSLKEGGKLIFIRHAYAPGNGDPKKFNLKDCSTQRNLSKIGIEQSKGMLLAFIDADDIWSKNKLEEQIKFMQDRAISFCHTSYKIINEKGEFLSLRKARNFILILTNRRSKKSWSCFN